MTHYYDFIGYKLIIDKFFAIARSMEFVMNGTSHRMNSITTYPFYIMENGWDKIVPNIEELPIKGDTIIGNDI